MDNPEKPTTQCTQYEEEQYKNATLLYTQTNTNDVNKTWAILQTTGGKDEPNKHKWRK
jgi:hypothetical protein